ncbi:MAG: flippase [Oscillospiraceae bacterium]|nr:flippase [Oscillospiraceae bacterium]
MEKPSVKKNFIYNTFFQILSVITPFITAPYVARVLGANGVGIYSYTSSIQTYFSMFATLGTASYGAREIARNRENAQMRSKLFWEIELMTVITTVICLAIWFTLILCSSANRIYYIVLTFSILATLFDISWFFTGLEQFKIIVIRNTILKILGVICIFLFVKTEHDLAKYILIFSMSSFLSSLSVWPYLKRYIVRVSFRDLKILRHFKETIVYFIPTISSSVYLVLDKTLIGLITKENSQNGYYQQAEKIIEIAKNISFRALNGVMGVRMSYLFAEKKFKEIHMRIENSINIILFMGIGCAFGISGIAKDFVPIFYGAGYEDVIYLLYIFCPVIVITGITTCTSSQYYVPVGKRMQNTKYILVGSAINLILNMIAIPKFKSYGAAVATIAAELVILILYIKNSSGYMPPRLLLKTGWKKLLAGSVMFTVVVLISCIKLTPIIKVAAEISCGAAVYIIMLLLLRDRWFIGLAKNMFGKIKRK